MAVRYTPTRVHHGFDRSASPDFQMVPANGTRVLTVHGSHGLEPTVIEADPLHPVLGATKSGTGSNVRLSLAGGPTAGVAFVAWARPSATLSGIGNDFMLEVSIKTERTVSTAFHYVDDGHRHATRRWIDDRTRRLEVLDRLIEGANALLLPQANVRLVRTSAEKLNVGQNLGRVVRFSSHLEAPPHNVDPAQHEWDDLFALRDTAAEFNVFFVREYEDDIHPNRDDADAATFADADPATPGAERMCVFEDRMDQTAAKLAHETVHALGDDAVDAHTHGSNPRFLMATGARGTGHFLTKVEINRINTTGT